MTDSTVEASPKKRILIVEDDEQSRRYVEVLLGKEYELHAASWAAPAWEMLNSMNIDLVLMDISLPGEENGLELTRRIRADEDLGQIPVIALTAHAFPRDRENSLNAGCNDYISKPFDRQTLIDTIRRYI